MESRKERRKAGKRRGASSTLLPLAALSLSAICLPVIAQNGTPTESEKALERAEKALAQEPGLAPETKAALQDLLRVLRTERGQGAPKPGTGTGAATGTGATTGLATGATPTATPGASAGFPFKVSGDFRLRHESSFNLDDQPSRHRERARFRIGGTYQVSDELMLGTRLSTGNRLDANSPHVTLGEVFHRFEVGLDRAFLSYKPKGVPGLTATAGKFAHPFWMNPVYGELVWDADVQPEGVALNYSRKGKGAIDRWDFTLGEYLLLEQPVSDARSFVAQAAVHGKMGKNWKPSVALGYYRHGDLTPSNGQAIVGENSGNATTGAGPTLDFASRFEILNSIAALRYDGGKYPLVFSGEYIKNLKANIPQDDGWSVGAALGSARKKGDWRAYYQWQKVGQDSVLSVVSQDDFLFQTNHRSHLIGANYQVRDNLGLHLWGLASARDRTFAGPTTDSGKTQWRLRFDTNLAF